MECSRRKVSLTNKKQLKLRFIDQYLSACINLSDLCLYIRARNILTPVTSDEFCLYRDFACHEAVIHFSALFLREMYFEISSLFYKACNNRIPLNWTVLIAFGYLFRFVSLLMYPIGWELATFLTVLRTRNADLWSRPASWSSPGC